MSAVLDYGPQLATNGGLRETAAEAMARTSAQPLIVVKERLDGDRGRLVRGVTFALARNSPASATAAGRPT
jgi:hypothetical protein